jgi:hypothetical protein
MSPGTRTVELNPYSAQQSLFALVQASLHKRFAQSQHHSLLCPHHSRPSLDTYKMAPKKKKADESQQDQ